MLRDGRVDPFVAIPALLLLVVGVWLWHKLISRMEPDGKAERINTALFNVVLFVPALVVIPLVKLTFAAVYPILNLKKLWREAWGDFGPLLGSLFAIFVMVMFFPVYALLAVVILTLFGQIPLW